MAGILNNKERLMDVLVTPEGRRQAAGGQFRIRFASFTDSQTFYESSGSFNRASDSENRIFFEAANRRQHVIVPEIEPGTNTVANSFRGSDFIIDGKTIAENTFRISQSGRSDTLYSGSAFKTQAIPRVLRGISKNFSDLQIIGTRDIFDDTSKFKIANVSTGSFDFHEPGDPLIGAIQRPAPRKDRDSESFDKFYNDSLNDFGILDLETSPSFFADDKLAHLPNFNYLPPINDVDADAPDSERLMGDYPLLHRRNVNQIQEMMTRLENRGESLVYRTQFLETSNMNNLVGQFFEFNNQTSEVEKLSIIDAGVYSYETTDVAGIDSLRYEMLKGRKVPHRTGHIFYVGKIFRDAHGMYTFLNIFTLVFSGKKRRR